jgi:hypothetical protein
VRGLPVGEWDAVEEDLTGLRFQQAGDDSGKGGLADAAGADNGEVVVFSQQEVEVSDDWFSVPAIAEGDVMELKGMVGGTRCPSRWVSCWLWRWCGGRVLGCLGDAGQGDQEP